MTIKPLFDALMKMLYRKNVITQEELNEYLIASEKSKGSSSADLVIFAIDRIGR